MSERPSADPKSFMVFPEPCPSKEGQKPEINFSLAIPANGVLILTLSKDSAGFRVRFLSAALNKLPQAFLEYESGKVVYMWYTDNQFFENFYQNQKAELKEIIYIAGCISQEDFFNCNWNTAYQLFGREPSL